MEIEVTIEILTPIHLGSGQADVNVDAEIIHDALGFPYFPAKRFKGLLYESAVEIFEMFDLAGIPTKNLSTLADLFHRESTSAVQLIVPNFYLLPLEEYKKFCAEWKYLQAMYPNFFEPADILNAYTSIRYQTRLEKGVAAEKSLHNMRVLNSGEKFYGKIELLNGDAKVINLLALAIKNIYAAGMKRNRGFGKIDCTANFAAGTAEKIVADFFAKEA